MNLHASGTWFWANLLHPFVMFFYFGYSGYQSGSEIFGMLFLIFLYSLIFSLPSLFISFLVIFLISILPATAVVKYFTWMIAAPAIVILNVLLFALLAGSGITFSDLQIAMPAMIAVVIIILIRHNQFLNLISQLKETKHENNLV
jgi:hypothetical protein